MRRVLYRSLLHLHPAAFRSRFAGEMLWIFDRATDSGDARGLVCDALVSLLRQWVLRTPWWKLPAAVLAALIQIALLGLIFGVFRHRVHVPVTSRPTDISPGNAIELILGASGAIFLMVIATTMWVIGFVTSKMPRTGRRVLGSDAAGITR